MTFKPGDIFNLSINAICSEYEVNKVKGLSVARKVCKDRTELDRA